MGQNEFYIDIKYPSHRVEKAINWHRDWRINNWQTLNSDLSSSYTTCYNIIQFILHFITFIYKNLIIILDPVEDEEIDWFLLSMKKALKGSGESWRARERAWFTFIWFSPDRVCKWLPSPPSFPQSLLNIYQIQFAISVAFIQICIQKIRK